MQLIVEQCKEIKIIILKHLIKTMQIIISINLLDKLSWSFEPIDLSQCQSQKDQEQVKEGEVRL